MVNASGRPVDVYAHFQLDPAGLDSFFSNASGLIYSARLTGTDFRGNPPKLHWKNHEEVWIPVREGLALHGELALAQRDGRVIDTDCVVIIPGLLGHNDIHRLKDLADALRAAGFHALLLELCGHGQTNTRFPAIHYNFGTLEAADLLAVSEWLQNRPHVRRTGLIGFCWGANLALLAAWYDGRAEVHSSISDRLAARLRPVSAKRHFEAGVIAFSPVLRFEDIIDALETEQSGWRHPALAHLQDTICRRMKLKGFPNPSGSLFTLINDEFARSALDYPGAVEDGLDFLRLMPHRGRSDGDKLADCRVPVLIVQAANDPVAPAQDVADLCARVDNRNVAGLILPNGGHVGFAAYARSYYFSLAANFFDVKSGPATSRDARLTEASSGRASLGSTSRPSI